MALTDSQSAKKSASIAENAAAEAKSYSDIASKSEDYSNKAAASAASASLSESLALDAASEAAESAATSASSAEIAAIAEQNATLSSNVYPSVSAAQAAITGGSIPLGALFNVASSLDSSYVDQYQNISGVATFTGKQYPSKKYIDTLTDEITVVSESNAQLLPGFSGVAEMSTDKNGAVTSRRLNDGTTQFPAVMIGSNVEQVQTYNGSVFQSRSNGSLVIGMDDQGGIKMLAMQAYISTDYPGYSEIHADKTGSIFKRVHTNGTVEDVRTPDSLSSVPVVSADGGMAVEIDKRIYYINTNGDNSELTSDSGNINPVTFKSQNGDYFVKFASQEGTTGEFKLHRIAVALRSRIRQGNGDFIHAILVGQSLSVGGARVTQPAVTVTPRYPYGAVTFNGGPKFDSADPAKTVSDSDLEYLVPIAENIGKVNGQESDCSGLADRIFEKTGITNMASATGSSGKTLANISYGTPSFNATKLVMKRAYEIATGLGMKYIPYLVFIHGNADAGIGTSASVYKNGMLNLRIDYQTYLRSVLGDEDFTLKVFVQQFSNATVQAGATGADVNLVIGNAQYEICRDNPDFILTGTQYARPYVDKDHLSNNGYRTDGEIVGVAISEFISEDDVMALRPDDSNIIQSSSEITIPLLGGIGNAVIDAVRVSDPGNYGFRLVGATINSVTIDTGNVVKINKTGVATSVSYAYVGNRASLPGRLTGNRGCIRDSATDVSPVSGLPLYNDLVAFNKSL